MDVPLRLGMLARHAPDDVRADLAARRSVDPQRPILKERSQTGLEGVGRQMADGRRGGHGQILQWEGDSLIVRPEKSSNIAHLNAGELNHQIAVLKSGHTIAKDHVAVGAVMERGGLTPRSHHLEGEA